MGSHSTTWDSVENSRRSRSDENECIKNLYQKLPFCYKSSSQLTTVDGPAKLPTLRFTVSYVLKKAILLNALGIDQNNSGDNGNEQFFKEFRADHKDLVIIFDPSNFYHKQQLANGGNRSSGRNCDYLNEHEDDLEEAGKLVFISENCERFFDGHAPRIISKFESIYELLPKGDAEKLAHLVHIMIGENAEPFGDSFLLKFIDNLQPSNPKSYPDIASMEMQTSIRVLTPKSCRGDPMLDTPLVALRCRHLKLMSQKLEGFSLELDTLNLHITRASDNATMFIGFNPRNHSIYDLVHPTSLAYTAENFQRLCRIQKPSSTFVTRFTTSNCRSQLVLLTASVDVDVVEGGSQNCKVTFHPIESDIKRLDELIDSIALKKQTTNHQQWPPRIEPEPAPPRKRERRSKKTNIQVSAVLKSPPTLSDYPNGETSNVLAPIDHSAVVEPNNFHQLGEQQPFQPYFLPDASAICWYPQPSPYFQPQVLPNNNFYFNPTGAVYYPQIHAATSNEVYSAPGSLGVPTLYQPAPASPTTLITAPFMTASPSDGVQTVSEATSFDAPNSQETKVYASL